MLDTRERGLVGSDDEVVPGAAGPSAFRCILGRTSGRPWRPIRESPSSRGPGLASAPRARKERERENLGAHGLHQLSGFFFFLLS